MRKRIISSALIGILTISNVFAVNADSEVYIETQDDLIIQEEFDEMDIDDIDDLKEDSEIDDAEIEIEAEIDSDATDSSLEGTSSDDTVSEDAVSDEGIEAFNSPVIKYPQSTEIQIKSGYSDSSNEILSIGQKKYEKTTLDKSFYLSYGILEGTVLTYTSSNEKVIKVEADGKFVICGAGEAVVTIYAMNNQGGVIKEQTEQVKVIVSKVSQSISMSTSTITKKYGSAKFQIKASAKTAVTYKSSNTNVLTVDKNGYVTIVAKNSTKSAYVIVNAPSNDTYKAAAEKKVLVKWEKGNQSVTASNKTYSLGTKNKSLGAKAKTALTYKSSNTKVATVNSKGQITAKKVGTAKITISAKSTTQYNSAKKTITVKITKKSQSITAANKSYNIGTKNKSLGAKAKTTLSYKSSNKAIVTVTSKGKITAKKAGTAKITITAKGTGTYKSAKKTITIKVIKKSQTVSGSNKTYIAGAKNKALGAKAKTALSYKSSDTSIVTVNSKGQVTAKKAGTAKITVTAKATGTYKSAKKVITITVNPAATTISALSSPSEKKMAVTINKGSGISGYEIRYSTNSNMSGAKTVTTSDTKKTIAISEIGNSNVKYYVQVRTYKTVSGKKYYSGWSAAKSVTVKGHTTHDWKAVYKTVTHPATEDYYETVIVQEAWDEPVYEYRTICNNCGLDLTEFEAPVLAVHVMDCGSRGYTTKKIQTDTIHHKAITEQILIKGKEAWTEQIFNGYECSCGAEK